MRRGLLALILTILLVGHALGRLALFVDDALDLDES